MRRRDWIAAHPQAVARLRALVRTDGGSGPVRFLALRTLGTFGGRGVIEEAAQESISALHQVFGHLEVVRCLHDGRGGPEAEAELTLRGPGVEGRLVLSRLRALRDRLEIAAGAGVLELDARRGRIDERRLVPEGLASDGSVSLPSSPRTDGGGGLRHPWELADGRLFPELAGRRVFVTGATGFIGARLVERLAENGASVTAGLRSHRRAARIARLGIRLEATDGVCGPQLEELVRGHDAVVNLAHDFAAAPGTNRTTALAVADACEAAAVPLLVQASSIAVYDGWPGDPLDEEAPCDAPGHGYKELKRAIERDLEMRQAAGRLRSLILQPTIVYGAFSSLWTDRYAERFAIGDVAVPGSGLCEGVHVDDVVDAMLAAIASPGAHGRYIVSGPEPFAWTQMFAAFVHTCRSWGELRIEPATTPAPAPPDRLPRPPSKIAAAKARALGAAARFTRLALGEARLARLRTALLKAAARGRRPVFRPAAENPRLFANRAAVSTARMRGGLIAPRIGIERGTQLVRAYLSWRYCPHEDRAAGEEF